MKKLGVVAMLLLTIGSFAAPIKADAAGGCSNFYCIDMWDSYCVDKGCGFLWLNPETNYQDFLWEKECINGNGDIHYEYDMRQEKLGCC